MEAERMSGGAHEERLKDILFNGLLKDILMAEQAYLLAKTIGDHSEAVNASDHKDLFGVWQLMCSNEQTMAAARMFDKPSGYPTRSIPVALQLLEEHEVHWQIRGPKVLSDVLNVQMDPQHLTKALVQHFRDTMPQDTLKRLKESRDKVLAHNEAIDAAQRNYLTWGDANAAVEYAKAFFITVGQGYCGISGLDLTVNATPRWEYPMQHLLRKVM
jgi:hypothetical protein